MAKNFSLLRQVLERKKFLRKVVEPVEEFVRKNGKEIAYYEGSSHTHIVKRLENFAGFTFEADTGQSMMGGNDIRIWYHPGRVFRDGGLDSAFDREGTPVLNLSYTASFDINKDCLVTVFSEDKAWQKALLRVLKNKDKILAKMAKEQEKKEQKENLAAEENKSDKALREEASRLKVG